jgi:hypothetical protein
MYLVCLFWGRELLFHGPRFAKWSLFLGINDEHFVLFYHLHIAKTGSDNISLGKY